MFKGFGASTAETDRLYDILAHTMYSTLFDFNVLQCSSQLLGIALLQKAEPIHMWLS